MKPSFKYIVNSIIASLVVILFFQFYWLKQLYNSIEEDIKKDVIQCITDADQTELVMRMKIINKQDTASSNDVNITVSKSIEDFEEKKELNTNSTDDKKITKSDPNDLFFKTFTKTLSSAIHQYVDLKIPTNINYLDSTINRYLEDKNIKAKVLYIELVDEKNNKVLMASDTLQLNKNKAFDINNSFSYPYIENGDYSYRIYTESLTYTILIRMAGILISTLLIIIILSFAFYYLIKTVLRQKTLEEMKDDFVNSMTHELKTPIAVAYSITDTLLNFKQGDDKEKRNKYLAICKDQLSGLSGLVEQILSMSMERREGFVLDKKEFAVYPIIENLVEHHRLKSKKEINFAVEIIPPHDLIIYADPIHFSNIISNLIDNAIKYSTDIVYIDIQISKDANNYKITITDKGLGIPSEKQAYIFDKFYRISDGNKYQVKGYGLGLFYVKTMVEKHDGTIGVNSKQNKGTTFTIFIPIHDNEHED